MYNISIDLISIIVIERWNYHSYSIYTDFGNQKMVFLSHMTKASSFYFLSRTLPLHSYFLHTCGLLLLVRQFSEARYKFETFSLFGILFLLERTRAHLLKTCITKQLSAPKIVLHMLPPHPPGNLTLEHKITWKCGRHMAHKSCSGCIPVSEPKMYKVYMESVLNVGFQLSLFA